MTDYEQQDHESSLRLEELLDIKAFQALCESFSQLTGIGTAILDLDGKVLIASGWQRICTHFHRQHPQTRERCRESDTVLANQLRSGEKYNVYQCQNGLCDVAVPIIIEGIHLGNLFTGQFFEKPPDRAFFLRQAKECGFDTEEYMALVDDVPVFSPEQTRKAVEFLWDLTTVITSGGLDKKRLKGLNRELERRVEERTQEIELERQFSDSLISSLPGVMYLLDHQGRFHRWNKNFETVTGYSGEEVRKANPLDFFGDETDKQKIAAAIDQVFRERSATVEAKLTTREGRQIPYFLTGYHFVQDDQQYLVGVGLDISQRTAIEAEKEILIARLEESLAKVKQLSGFLPICMSCKKIRDDTGYWNQLEAYIRDRSEAEFSHSLCPDCATKLYPGLALRQK